MNITALIRADIDRRNWDRVHIAGDRRQPFMLGDARRRLADGRSVVVRSQALAA